MKIMSHQFVAMFMGAALIFTGCEQDKGSRGWIEEVALQERMSPHPNPTSYGFDAPVSGVQDAIKKAFDEWRGEQAKKYQGKIWEGDGDAETKHALSLALQQSGGSLLLWKGDGVLISQDLPTKSGNENDAYLSGGNAPVGESQVYFKDGQPLIYYADFHIHLTAIDPKKTRVEIFTYSSRVVAGVDKSWSPHGPSFIFVDVPLTTIEQYQILLEIGEQLGTKDMPPLVIPGSDTPVKELTLPRER